MWKKIDFHHHPKTNNGSSKQLDHKKIIDCMSKDYNLIAVTDHNKISFREIEEYNTYISEKNYNITVLPGIELGFKLGNLSFHLILIFSNEKMQELKKHEKDIFGDYLKCKNNEADYNSIFLGIINKLRKHDLKFYSIPHYNKSQGAVKSGKKSSRNANEKTHPDEFSDFITFHDFLDGFPTNKKYVNRCAKKIKAIYRNTGHDKVIISGTDRSLDMITNEKELKIQLEKLPWFYNIKGFNEIEKIALYKQTRISTLKSEPKIAERFIESVVIKDVNEPKPIEIKFKPGLNSIIGRRGSGKTYLVKNIINAIDSEDSSFTENGKTFTVNYSGNKTVKNKVVELEQNALSNTIKEAIKEIYKGKDNWMDSISWNKMGIDAEIMCDLFDCIKKSIEELVDQFTVLFDSVKNKNIIMKGEKAASFSIEFLNTSSEVLKDVLNTKEIEMLQKDKEIVDCSIKKGPSDWLKSHLVTLQGNLNKIGHDPKYKQSVNMETIISFLTTAKNHINSSSTGSKVTIEKDVPLAICNSIISTHAQRKEVENYFNNVEKNYKKYCKDYHSVQLEDDKRLSTIFKNFTVKKVFKIKKDYDLSKFKNKLILSKYTKNDETINLQDKIKIKDLFKLKKRQHKEKIDFLDTREQYFVNGIMLNDLSLGQQHEIFVREVLSNDFDVLFLDQPDDDLDSKTIHETIIKTLNRWGFSIQVIVITHDPKIVINSDSQETILSNYKIKGKGPKKLYENVTPDSLKKDRIYEILDARIDFPRIRYKKYGGYE